MGDVVDAIGGAFEAVFNPVGTIMDTVGGVVDMFSGGIGGIGDVLDTFTGIGGGGFGLGGLLSGGPLGGILGDIGGFPDPLGFLGGGGGIGGPLGGIIGDLIPNPLGDVFGILGGGGGGGPLGLLGGGLGGPLEGLAGGLFGGGGIVGNMLNFLPTEGLLLPAVMDGFGSVFGSVLGQLPQLGGLLGQNSPSDIMNNLLNFTKGFDPSAVLQGLDQGLRGVANLFPSISDPLKNVLGLLDQWKGGQNPQDILGSIASVLGKIPELGLPMMPFTPGQMVQIPGFASQLGNVLGMDISKIGPQLLGQLPIFTPPGLTIDPSILKVVPELVPAGAPAPSGGAAPAESTGGAGGTQGLMNAFEKNMDAMNDIMDQISNLDPESDDYQKQMMKLQQKLNMLQQMQEAITQMIAKINELNEKIIQNIGR